MITQQVNQDDPVLGFMQGWFAGLAKRVEELHLLVLMPGKHSLPDNVIVHSMGKEQGLGRLGKTLNFQKIMRELVWTRKVDVVFTHMCPVYAVLASPWCKLRGVPLVMWHAHASMSRSLRIANVLVDKVLTSSLEGYPLHNSRIVVTGQGIDTDVFHGAEPPAGKIRMMSASRITRIKDFETLIEAARILRDEWNVDDFEMFIVGSCYHPDDKNYKRELIELIERKGLSGHIRFEGAVPHETMPDWYRKSNIFVTASNTGSIDKTVIEAMSCERIPLTCNKAFPPVFGDLAPMLYFEKGNAREFADKIRNIINMSADERTALGSRMRDIAVRDHGQDALMEKFTREMEKMVKVRK